MTRLTIAALFVFGAIGRLGAQTPPQLEVQGEITAAKALTLLYGNYDPQEKQSRHGQYIMPLDERTLVLDGKRQWFLLTLSNSYGRAGCPLPCLGTMGVAVFEQRGPVWVLKANERKLCKDCDSQGDIVHTPSWNPIQWGTNAVGLLIDEDSGGCGYAANYRALYALSGAGFRRIFSIKTSDSFSPGGCTPIEGPYRWEAALDFGPPGPDGIYDIVVKMTSPPTRQRYRKDSLIPFAGVYRYDGKIYKHVRTQIPLPGGEN